MPKTRANLRTQRDLFAEQPPALARENLEIGNFWPNFAGASGSSEVLLQIEQAPVPMALSGDMPRALIASPEGSDHD